MKAIITPLLLLIFLARTSIAQTPDWSQNIAPILYNHCATCHHSGGIAPFSLMTYNDAVSNAATINTAVQSGEMPPWPPDPNYSRLAHERLLSPSEKAAIAAWVNGGTPQGNPNLAPPPPVFNNNGDLPGTPDLVVRMPVYTSTADTADVYRCFVLPTGLTADKYITGIEAVPGNRSMVHHVLIYADTTNASSLLDSADPGPGYTHFGDVGSSGAFMVGVWVPGSSPLAFPNGFGEKLPANAKIVIQVHYPEGTNGLKDSTEIHLRLASGSQTLREISIYPALNHQQNITPPLFIPANTVKSFTEVMAAPYQLSLLGLFPHMHLLGQTIKCYGVSLNGDTQRLINIPKWDFHWQNIYFFKKVLKMDAFTIVKADAVYDNTSNNPNNPSSPPKDVSAGEKTTDEMMVVYVVYTPYQAGDENIVIDSTVDLASQYVYYQGQQLLQPYPVPASKELIAKYYFEKAGNASLSLLNLNGQVALRIFENRKIDAGYRTYPINVANLPAGVYTLSLQTKDGNQSQKIVITH